MLFMNLRMPLKQWIAIIHTSPSSILLWRAPAFVLGDFDTLTSPHTYFTVHSHKSPNPQSITQSHQHIHPASVQYPYTGTHLHSFSVLHLLHNHHHPQIQSKKWLLHHSLPPLLEATQTPHPIVQRVQMNGTFNMQLHVSSQWHSLLSKQAPLRIS